MLRYLIQSNYACLLACLFLVIFIVADRSFVKKIRVPFCIATFTVVALCFADSIDYTIAQGNTPSIVRSFTSAIGYSLRPFTVYCILLVLRRRETGNAFLISLPLIFNAIIMFTSIFTGWAFSFDIVNKFVRGPLGYLPFIVSGFYIVALVVCSILKFRHSDTSERTIVFVIAGVSIFATAIECSFGFKFLLNATIALSLVAYYLFLHIQTYKRDTLTALLSRRNFFIDAMEYEKITLTIVAMDINNLKKINDSGGHDAGDAAIITIVNTVLSVMPRDCTLYRTGGDEFMMLCKKSSLDDTVRFMKSCDELLNKTPYSLAWGVARYDKECSFYDACKKADANMYADKQARKNARLII